MEAMTASGAPVALDRMTVETCQCGTKGCCVDHQSGRDDPCETW